MVKGAESKNPSRTLIYIPIIHTQADMGALGEPVRQAALHKIGKTAWKRKMSAIDQIWTKIEKVIDHLNLSYEKVRLYQDGLPVCGKEEMIVKDLAKAGSRNHKLLLRLIEKGATILGTESAELLVEEYELYKSILISRDPSKASRIESRQKGLTGSLLKKRDRYMANRINETLRIGEIGIIFVGMLHSLGNLLDKDIRVSYPMGRTLNP